MSNSNTGLIIIVVIALFAIFFIGGYLLIGGLSSSSEDSEEQSPESQILALQQELSSLRQTNFDLSMQISAAQSESARLKQQVQLLQFSGSSSSDSVRKCNNLEDDRDSIKDDLNEAKDDQDKVDSDINVLNALMATQVGGATPAQTAELNALEKEWDDLERDIDDFEEDYDNARDDLRDADC